MTRKFLAMLLAMAMLLSMVIVPASANEQPESLTEQAQEVAAEEGEALPEEQPEALPKEEPLEESVQMPLLDVNALADKTVTLTMTPRPQQVTLENGVAYVTYDLYLQTSDATPIQACAFNLAADAGMELAADVGGDAQGFFYYCEADALSRVDLAANHDSFGHPYELIAYEPSSGYFALSGYDLAGGGIADTQTKIMSIVAKFTAPGSYTLDAVNCIAGNGKLEDGITQQFGTFDVVSAPVTVKKAAGAVNVTAAADKTSVDVGDTFTVTLSNKAMSVSSFTAGLSFDTDVLEVTQIVTKDGYTALSNNASRVLPAISTVAEANKTGKVGFGIVAGSDHAYAAADIVTVTFKAVAAGSTAVTPYETSTSQSASVDGDGTAVNVTAAVAAQHTHTMEAHPAVTPTATTAGNTAYWYCTECEKYFSNASGTNEIAENSWVLPVLGDAFTVQLVPSAGQVCQGGEFSVMLAVENVPDFAGFQVIVTYDTDVLEPVEGSWQEWNEKRKRYDEVTGDYRLGYNLEGSMVYNKETAGEVSLVYSDTVDTVWDMEEPVDTELATIFFKVKNNAANGDTALTISTATGTEKWVTINSTLTSPTYVNTSVTTGHDYDTAWSSDANNHWHECTICGEKQPNTEAVHSFALRDNGDGTHSNVCSVCGYVEEGSTVEHSSDTWLHDETGHWKVCACGTKFAEADHTGTATCVAAATCSVCDTVFGDVNPTNHVDALSFTAAKAATCVAEGNVAYYTCEHCHKNFSDAAGTLELTNVVKPIDPDNHAWDDGMVTPSTATVRGSILYTCENDPGHTKTELMPQYSSGDFRVELSTIEKVYAGKTVTLNVSVANNPGFAGMGLHFVYDDTYLTLTDIAAKSGMSGSWVTNLEQATAVYSSTANYTADGQILNLTFDIAADAPADAIRVSVEYQKGNIAQVGGTKLDCTQTVGYVKVINKLLGDVNSDCVVDVSDSVLLMRHVAKYKDEIDLSVADVTKDGAVDVSDTVKLMRCIAGFKDSVLNP